jgi:hypothetical protein
MARVRRLMPLLLELEFEHYGKRRTVANRCPIDIMALLEDGLAPPTKNGPIKNSIVKVPMQGGKTYTMAAFCIGAHIAGEHVHLGIGEKKIACTPCPSF